MLALATARNRVGGFNFPRHLRAACRPSETAANGPAYPVEATYTYDDASGSIHYEEYHPFGTTSFHSLDSTAEVSTKRYRYIGKERDEGSGLYYIGARYYAPWLGRWTRADPAGLVDGPGSYSYARNNPVRLADPGGTFAESPSDHPETFSELGQGAQVTLEDEIVTPGPRPVAFPTFGEAVLTEPANEEPVSLAIPDGGPSDFVAERAARQTDLEALGRRVTERSTELGLTAATAAAMRGTGVGNLISLALEYDEASSEFAEALEAQQRDPSPENEARVQAAADRLLEVQAGASGFGGTPTGSARIPRPTRPARAPTTEAVRPASTRVSGPTDAGARVAAKGGVEALDPATVRFSQDSIQEP